MLSIKFYGNGEVTSRVFILCELFANCTCFAGGFGSVYKGSLGDGTLVAVKKLDRVLPHGEKEFITEVNTIGSMHHMNLVRLCGYCSEGSHRYAVS